MTRGRTILIFSLIIALTSLLTDCGQVKNSTVSYTGKADKGGKTFITNCIACHNRRSDEYAPTQFDLMNSITKRPDGWVIKYILNSEKVFNSGDTIAQRLRREYKDNRMLVFEDKLTENDVKDIIAHLTRGAQY